MEKMRFLTIFLAFVVPLGATDLCGMVLMPTTLNKAKSPYRITGDLFVPAPSRLTIEAGVEILIAAKQDCKETFSQKDWSDSQFVSLKIDGAFYVKGTPEAPVTIRPEHPATGKVLWDGIRITGQSPSSARIQFLQLSGANRALQVSKSKFIVENSFFLENNTGIWLGEKAHLDIRNNLFQGNTSAGIFLQYAAPNIEANIFYENYNYGIWADSRKGLEVDGNLFWKSGEADCWHCLAEIGKRSATNSKGDSTDASGNIFADPVFQETPSEMVAKKSDITESTSKAEVQDTTLLKLHEKADSLGKAGLAPKPVFQAQGIGKWKLSKYSPALDAGPDSEDFLDANGTRGDMGPWGATAKYKRK